MPVIEKDVEKQEILQALGEVRQRLSNISDATSRLREDVVGNGDGQEGGPSSIPSSHLDGKVFELFPILTDIEENLRQVSSRLGSRTQIAKSQTSRAGNF